MSVAWINLVKRAKKKPENLEYYKKKKMEKFCDSQLS